MADWPVGRVLLTWVPYPRPHVKPLLQPIVFAFLVAKCSLSTSMIGGFASRAGTWSQKSHLNKPCFEKF